MAIPDTPTVMRSCRICCCPWAFESAGKGWKAPAQNLMDFIGRRPSAGIKANSYAMGVSAVDLNAILPTFICEELLYAFAKWKEAAPLFVSEPAVLLAPETRTSSPVRIKRNENYESVTLKNLVPIGEGAGYSGGITSSAVDAIKAVERRSPQGCRDYDCGALPW